MQDCLILKLFCNASDDSKIKPLLVYRSENPYLEFKISAVKSSLNVM